jgi:hypothetical protein
MAQSIATPPDGFDLAVDTDEEFATVCEDWKQKATAVAQTAYTYSFLLGNIEDKRKDKGSNFDGRRKAHTWWKCCQTFPAMIRNMASHFRPFLLTFLY